MISPEVLMKFCMYGIALDETPHSTASFLLLFCLYCRYPIKRTMYKWTVHHFFLSLFDIFKYICLIYTYNIYIYFRFQIGFYRFLMFILLPLCIGGAIVTGINGFCQPGVRMNFVKTQCQGVCKIAFDSVHQFLHYQSVKCMSHLLISHLYIVKIYRGRLFSYLYFFVLRLNIPVNNFSVMSGRSQRFLVLASTVGS